MPKQPSSASLAAADKPNREQMQQPTASLPGAENSFDAGQLAGTQEPASVAAAIEHQAKLQGQDQQLLTARADATALDQAPADTAADAAAQPSASPAPVDVAIKADSHPFAPQAQADAAEQPQELKPEEGEDKPKAAPAQEAAVQLPLSDLDR